MTNSISNQIKRSSLPTTSTSLTSPHLLNTSFLKQNNKLTLYSNIVMRGRSIHTSNKQLTGPHRLQRDIHRYEEELDVYRSIRTASLTNKIRFSKKVMLANKQILPQDLRNVSILHQKTQSESQGSVIMLPKNLEEARNPKLKRQGSSREGQIEKHRVQQQSGLQKSNRWVDFSRKNLQQITSRLKTIRTLKYLNQYTHNEAAKETIQKLPETSLACKSLQPIRASTPNMKEFLFNNELENRQSKGQLLRKRQSEKNMEFEQQIRQRSKSSLGNEFHAKLKKKCLQNNPHILASVIKRKNLKQDKLELYQFVQKIIQKSKKH